MRRAIALLACAGIVAGSGRAGPAHTERMLTGDPGRGGIVFGANGCGFCHTFTKAGSKGPSAPDLDWSLRADAPRARLSVGLFALSRIVWGGRSMPAFNGTLSSQELDDLVSFLVGKPFAAPAGGVAAAPLFQPPPSPVAQPALVARWFRGKRLPRAVAPGARLFAKVACLACHTYLGDGARSLGGRDLTAIGATRTRAFLLDYVRRPLRYGNRRMPSFGVLGRADLERLAAFLSASRGR